MRTFKRAKYASRDDILEEKRFEASFSVLFTSPSRPNPAMVRTSPIPTIPHSHRNQNPLARTFHASYHPPEAEPHLTVSKTIHSSTSNTFFKKKEQNRIAAATPKPKAWRGSKERKSRLTEKLREALGYS